MKIMIDKDAEVTISHTIMNYGKMVIDVDSSYAKDIVSSIIEYVGIVPIINSLDENDIDILQAFTLDAVIKYYGKDTIIKQIKDAR